MSFVRNALSVMFTSAVIVPLGLVTSIVLARWLSVPDRALLAVALALTAITVEASSLGLPSASVYRLRRAQSHPSRVVSAEMLLALTFSALAVAVCLLIKPMIMANFLQGAAPLVFLLAVAMVPFQQLSAVLNGIARGIDRFDLQNAYRFLIQIGTLSGLLAALVVWKGGLLHALAAFLIVRITFSLLLAAAVIRTTGIAPTIERNEITQSLSFGFKSYAQNLAGQLHERVDVFMLAYLLDDPSQVAFYAIAISVAEQLKLIPEGIGTALFPQLAGMSEPSAGSLTAAVSRHSLIWTVACVLLLAPAAPFLIPFLYGAAYEASVLPFLILLPAVALLTVFRVPTRYFAATAKQGITISVFATSAAVNIALNLLLIPQYGVLGAAMATLASYVLESILITFLFLKASGQKVSAVLIFRRDDLEPYRRRLTAMVQRKGLGH